MSSGDHFELMRGGKPKPSTFTPVPASASRVAASVMPHVSGDAYAVTDAAESELDNVVGGRSGRFADSVK